MKPNHDRDSASSPLLPARLRWVFLISCVFILLLGMLGTKRPQGPALLSGTPDPSPVESSAISIGTGPLRWAGRGSAAAPARTAEEIVAGKLVQFIHSRRDLANEMARRKGVIVPEEVERFFDALESATWEEIERQWQVLAKKSRQYHDSTDADSPKLDPVWSAVLDAYGVAEQVHEWPAQQLLDYGNAILDSLRPGMVYVGGTDEGRWIPELLNETSGREPHVIVTQNAMADGRYIEYMHTLYGDRLATLTEEDSKRAIQEYMADAQRRMEHDEQFPDEPKQLRFGEDVKMVNGNVEVGGQVAVMSINEKLLQALMEKNPGLDFAVQESSPLRGTYGDALPLGPLMELGAKDERNAFTQERASQALDYWRTKVQEISTDPEAMNSSTALTSYAHIAAATANLLTEHGFATEAEEAYRLAAQLWPGSAKSIGGLVDLLVRGGRDAEASKLLEDFHRNHPDQWKDLEQMRATARSGNPATPLRGP